MVDFSIKAVMDFMAVVVRQFPMMVKRQLEKRSHSILFLSEVDGFI
jgi:hypothetical protein